MSLVMLAGIHLKVRLTMNQNSFNSKRLEGQIKELEEKSEGLKMEIVKVQQILQGSQSEGVTA